MGEHVGHQLAHEQHGGVDLGVSRGDEGLLAAPPAPTAGRPERTRRCEAGRGPPAPRGRPGAIARRRRRWPSAGAASRHEIVPRPPPPNCRAVDRSEMLVAVPKPTGVRCSGDRTLEGWGRDQRAGTAGKMFTSPSDGVPKAATWVLHHGPRAGSPARPVAGGALGPAEGPAAPSFWRATAPRCIPGSCLVTFGRELVDRRMLLARDGPSPDTRCTAGLFQRRASATTGSTPSDCGCCRSWRGTSTSRWRRWPARSGAGLRRRCSPRPVTSWTSTWLLATSASCWPAAPQELADAVVGEIGTTADAGHTPARSSTGCSPASSSVRSATAGASWRASPRMWAGWTGDAPRRTRTRRRTPRCVRRVAHPVAVNPDRRLRELANPLGVVGAAVGLIGAVRTG